MKAKKRNRSAEALAQGRRLAMFEISQEFDQLLEQCRAAIKAELGTCTRVQALEAMGRAGAKKILEKSRKGLDRD